LYASIWARELLTSPCPDRAAVRLFELHAE